MKANHEGGLCLSVHRERRLLFLWVETQKIHGPSIPEIKCPVLVIEGGGESETGLTLI
jgi:hypothetical protein